MADVKRIYGIETIDYQVKRREFEITSQESRAGQTCYMLRCAAPVDPWHMSNILTENQLNCILPLHTGVKEYHTIVYHCSEEKADEYMELAKQLRNNRLTVEIEQTQSQLDYLTGIRSCIEKNQL